MKAHLAANVASGLLELSDKLKERLLGSVKLEPLLHILLEICDDDLNDLLYISSSTLRGSSVPSNDSAS